MRRVVLSALLGVLCLGCTTAAPNPPAGSSTPPATIKTATTATAAAVSVTPPWPVHTPSVAASAVRCGRERWSVKTLADPGAGQLDRGPRSSSVAALRALPAPAGLPQAGRIAPTERSVFTVQADLVTAHVEADGDIHLVIADPQTGETMIVEFPDPLCTAGATAADQASMQQARDAFVAAYGLPVGAWLPLHGRATITGVGFYDRLHGQRGVAPNGIELHPVLRFAQ